MSKKSKILFGSDPELFALDKTGTFVMPPVIFRRDWGAEFTPDGRHPIYMVTESGVKIHEDGAAFEFSLSPSQSWEELFDKIEDARQTFSNTFLSRHDVYPELLALPTATWNVEKWKDEGDDFQMATEFGCDPDKDAFNTQRERVFDASLHPNRYGGGHIHFSGVREISESPLIAVKCLALTVGLAATAFSDEPDLDRERVFRYGKPGKFRVQNYGKLYNDIPDTDKGIEYRTPSNRWTANKNLAEKLFQWAQIGIDSLLVGGLFKDIKEDFIMEAVSSMMRFDQGAARQSLAFIESKV